MLRLPPKSQRSYMMCRPRCELFGAVPPRTKSRKIWVFGAVECFKLQALRVVLRVCPIAHHLLGGSAIVFEYSAAPENADRKTARVALLACLTDELPDELRKNSHGTDVACGRKRRRHGRLWLVEPRGFEPLTSSLRRGMPPTSHGGSRGHEREKRQILLRKVTINSIRLLTNGTEP